MRLYIYLNFDIAKCMAARMSDVSFDIDFFEYSEKRGYTTNNNTFIRPEFENNQRHIADKVECYDKSRVDVSHEKGNLCNVEIQKRYINIEDVSSIKKNKLYYDIIDKLTFDNRVKKLNGKITELNEKYFKMDENKFLINKEIYDKLIDIYENSCDITTIGYKINCLNAENDIFRVISIYIE